jgi:hypothetical protein
MKISSIWRFQFSINVLRIVDINVEDDRKGLVDPNYSSLFNYRWLADKISF